MLQAELKVVGGKHEGEVIPLSAKKFLIGREQDCHLRTNSDLISRHHCVFNSDDFTVRLRDLGSTNGTYVNGERVRGQVVLKPGDQIRIGKLNFEVLIHETAAVQQGGESGTPAQPEAPVAPQQPAPPQAPPETSELSAFDTSIQNSPNVGQPQNNVPPAEDTAILQQQPQQPLPPQQPAYPYPQQPQQQQYYPQQPGQPQQYQQFQHPQQQYQQPYPGQTPPQPYPQMQQPYPQQPQQPQQQVPQRGSLPVQLPPPEQTGALQPEQPQQPQQQEQEQPQQQEQAENSEEKQSESEEKSSNKEGDTSNTAADIIRQYMTRRPGADSDS